MKLQGPSFVLFAILWTPITSLDRAPCMIKTETAGDKALLNQDVWGARWNNLGYWGSFITFLGATIFWISTIVGVPNVLPDESVHYVEWDILFWLTQVR